MIDFLTAGPNLPFAVALAMMLIMAVIEGIGMLFGMGLFHFLDHLAPDLHVGIDTHDVGHAAHVDTAHAEGLSALDRLMGWLHFGRVPVLILLVVFLTSFGLLGFSLQAMMLRTSGHFLPGVLASAAALPLALPPVRWFGGWLARILPGDETTVVSQDSLIGRVATIVLGEAAFDSPAQARLKDQHGQQHYVMVAPDEANERFVAGDAVLLVARAGATYRAIRNTNQSLNPT